MKEHFAFLPQLLRQGLEEGCFPSAVAAVGAGADVLCIAVAGDADLDTRFDMASMTKILCPTMLSLRALEEGDLTLDDSVARFFDAPPDKAGITVRQLMTHTGGFEPAFFLSEEIDDPKDVVRCLLTHPLAAPPDGTPRYSCMGTILLGKMLEALYGEPLDALARKRVFEPLEMMNTCYNPTGGNIAPTEVSVETGVAWRGVVHDENARFLGGVSANAGVFSDIRDLCRYASMLSLGGAGFLSPATVRLAITNHTPGHAVHRGLGFHLPGFGSFFGDLLPGDSFGHTGFTGTSLAIDPGTGFFALLLTNRIHPTRQNEKLFRFRRVFHNKTYATYRACTANA